MQRPGFTTTQQKFIPTLLIPFRKHKCKGISTIDTFCDIITTNFICRVKSSLSQSRKLPSRADTVYAHDAASKRNQTELKISTV